ncbi:IS66 family insertion sequence element accessory protein TnpB [Muricomes intestini]|uniref:IS66 family insertion sequence element accessory protein TnpB n=1 Tax=Muricomes intestini TaxID=1796634 RepID=UPI002FDE01B3
MDQGNRALWKERIQEQASSGISMAAWCRQNHIKKSTFYYWKKRLHIESREIQPVAPQFAKLELPASPVPSGTTVMMDLFVKDARHIYLACGATDFRKQSAGLAAIVNMQFELDPFINEYVFLFCNRKRNAIKVLRYDSNGFILANKKLLDGMKFQWPKDPSEVKEISYQQVQWLLQGLEIEQKRALHPVKMDAKSTCF